MVKLRKKVAERLTELITSTKWNSAVGGYVFKSEDISIRVYDKTTKSQNKKN